jgi:tetratricopeptide (TPR) repeat protein|tara:strand:+ start:37926 stop:39308 length:1383 start_codon:yes stop_codon:yes gene_type:complete
LKLRFLYIVLIFFGILFIPKQVVAQETETIEEQPTDDLGNVTDAFQENFFEALKQKGIENYELALDALRKAEKAAKGDPKLEAVVAFEKAKNLTELKQFEEAEVSFKQVLKTEPKRLDVLESLYDLYYQKNDYDSAIPLVQKLIEFDEDYKEDLANLYSRTRQFDKAIEVLDDLDETLGESDYRNALRAQIYRQTGNTEGQIESLETRIDKNPKKEQDYLGLIYLYSEEGNTEKAFATAKELLKNQPNSKQVHLALYKFYLDENNTEEAFKSMNIVFAASEIEKESKYKVLSDFIGFVEKNPQYETELENVVANFSETSTGKIYEQLGGYYNSKGQKETALTFYEKGIEGDPDNFSLLKNTLLLQIDFKKYDTAEKLSSDALAIFPAQPLLYLINGVAKNNLKNPDEAIESLNTGLDYLFDNPTMEQDFYKQLQQAYTLKGDSKKAAEYAKKAAQIKLTN